MKLRGNVHIWSVSCFFWWTHNEWINLNLDQGENWGYISSYLKLQTKLLRPRPREDWRLQSCSCCVLTGLWGITSLQMMQQWSKSPSSYCICRHKKQNWWEDRAHSKSEESDGNFGGCLTFMSSWCTPRAVKHRAALIAEAGGRGGVWGGGLQRLHKYNRKPKK